MTNRNTSASAVDRLPTEKEAFTHGDNVLAIETSVSVTVARKMVPLAEVLELVPGSVIALNTRCDKPLELEAGGQSIARGKAITVGEHLALRIT